MLGVNGAEIALKPAQNNYTGLHPQKEPGVIPMAETFPFCLQKMQAGKSTIDGIPTYGSPCSLFRSKEEAKLPWDPVSAWQSGPDGNASSRLP